MDNTKTAEEVEKITARLYDFNNIPHKTGINPTAFQLGAKAMWRDQVEPLKKRIEELEDDKKELIKMVQFYQKQPPFNHGK